MSLKSKLLNHSKLHLFGVEMAFLELSNYYQIIEASFVSEADLRISDSRKKLEEVVAGYNAEGYEAHLTQEFAEQIAQLTYYFPHAFRSSFLIQVFSFVEFELKEICNRHHRIHKTDISIADLKGTSDLDKAKVYFTKVCKVNMNYLQPEWSYLLDIRKIRNALVHHAGIVLGDHGDREQIISFIEREAGIEFKEKVKDGKPKSLREDLTVMITGQAFIDRLLSMSEELFIKLLDVKLLKI